MTKRTVKQKAERYICSKLGHDYVIQKHQRKCKRCGSTAWLY